MVVNFFASWCDACAFELPGFAEASDELRDEVVFVGVNSLETGDGMGMVRDFGLAESGFILAKDIGGTTDTYRALKDNLESRGPDVPEDLVVHLRQFAEGLVADGEREV